MTGIMITVEGGEGVGKSLFCQGLRDALVHQGKDVLLTREPGGTEAGQQLREFFLSPPEHLLAMTELFVLSAARYQHVAAKLHPTLKAGSWVVCDRFLDSTRVYQKLDELTAETSEETVEQIMTASVAGLEPHVTFLLDCPVEVSMTRTRRRSAMTAEDDNRFDDAPRKFHQNIRDRYLALSHRFQSRFVIIDASESPEAMVHHAMEQLGKFLA